MTAGPGFSSPGPATPQRVPGGIVRSLAGVASPAVAGASPPCVAHGGERTTARPVTASERLNVRVLDAFRRLAAAEARIVVTEAELMDRLFAVRGHLELGFAQFGDCVRETLGVSPRHAADRRRLHQLLRDRPNVEAAFLEGHVTSCQALAIRTVLTDDNEAEWIGLCSHLTVAELKRRVRDERPVERMSPPEDEERLATISFTAPPAVAVAFDQAMETARRTLGASVPRYYCLEAILAEAAPQAAPSEADASPPGTPAGASRSAGSDAEFSDAWTRSFTVRPRVRITLNIIDRELEGLDELIETSDSGDPRAIVTSLRALQIVGRPLRYLLGRLLSELHGTGTLRLAEFAEKHLKVSDRTAWSLLHEAGLFKNTTIAEAHGSGRIGIGQAVTIGRVAPADRLGAWIERAEAVTHRQFQREAAIFERLQDYFPALAFRHPGPMPEPGLENLLRRELMDRGWTEEDIESEIRRAGAGGLTSGPDPAEDPGFMRRLEILLEFLVVTAFDTAPTPQTIANAALPMRTIRVRAPESIARWWRAAIRGIQIERPQLPVWACATLLIREAVETWEAEAAQFHPVGRAILERDGYLCQAPGCSRRRDLQVHHIRFRSQGGDNRPENRVTLCFFHHQILLHETGTLAVRGAAPHDLTWTVGPSTLRGERYFFGSRSASSLR